jgi:hypothetical protein
METLWRWQAARQFSRRDGVECKPAWRLALGAWPPARDAGRQPMGDNLTVQSRDKGRLTAYAGAR